MGRPQAGTSVLYPRGYWLGSGFVERVCFGGSASGDEGVRVAFVQAATGHEINGKKKGEEGLPDSLVIVIAGRWRFVRVVARVRGAIEKLDGVGFEFDGGRFDDLLALLFAVRDLNGLVVLAGLMLTLDQHIGALD